MVILQDKAKLDGLEALCITLQRYAYPCKYVRDAKLQSLSFLGTLSADAAGELNVFRHDGDMLGVDGTEVCVLEESNQARFTCFLKGHHS